MEDEQGLIRVVRQHLFIQIFAFPAFEGFRLFYRQTCPHREFGCG